MINHRLLNMVAWELETVLLAWELETVLLAWELETVLLAWELVTAASMGIATSMGAASSKELETAASMKIGIIGTGNCC